MQKFKVGWMNMRNGSYHAKNISIGEGFHHDATAIFKEAYKLSPIVVLSSTNVFIQCKLQVGVSIATNEKDINVLEIVQKAGIVSGGMAIKANFALQDQQVAISAILEQGCSRRLKVLLLPASQLQTYR